MAANKKFTPRASANLIEGEVTDIVETTEEEVIPAVEAETETPVEAPVEEKTDEVTFTAKTESKPIERMVKIRLAKKYDGCIGGEWYHFAKDQVVTVPENVKRILNSKEGMLKPL
mgnify:CR=1 FL=1|jgi:hypothetical protein